MKRLGLLLLIFCVCFAQTPPQTKGPPPSYAPPGPNPSPGAEADTRLLNGKLQRDEIVKSDYRKNLEDAAELAKLAEEVKADLERDDKYIVSVKTLKKTEDIEKLAKNIHARLKRY